MLQKHALRYLSRRFFSIFWGEHGRLNVSERYISEIEGRGVSGVTRDMQIPSG
jgi:hypothetical protein